MQIHILTLFPEYFDSVLMSSILKRAQSKKLVKFSVIDIRKYTHDQHHMADDRPFGGGPGMVMKIEPIAEALEELAQKYGRAHLHIVLTSAKGRSFSQKIAQDYAQVKHLVVICGHYAGVDERVAQYLIDEEIRIGDYVLTGGEPAAIVMIDAVTRLVPGVLGNEDSPKDESHSQPGLGGYPVYTRPEVFNGWPVPPVLLSGDHQKIAQWRVEQRRKLD